MKNDGVRLFSCFSLHGPGSSERIISTLALLAAMVLWGSSFVAMKYAFTYFSPMIVIFGRMAIASICFLPFVPAFCRLPLTRKHILPLLVMTFCEPCLYFLFEAAALQRTTASQASMITTMLPLLVALASGLFLGERITRRTVAGFILAAAGALWLSLAGRISEQAPNPLLGNLLEFLAMVSATGYIILMKQLSRTLPTLFLTAMQAFIGTLFFAPLLLLPVVEFPETISLPALLSILYLGTFVTIGAYGLYNFGVSRVPANQAAAFINLIPVLTLVFGFFLLGERLSSWQLTACVLVFGGVFLSQDTTAQ
jgi:drug/metabolite transporter (DMT)-like permease